MLNKSFIEQVQDVFNPVAQVTQVYTDTKEGVSEQVETIKTGAIAYGSASLFLQALSTGAIVLMAYCTYKNFCGRKK